MSSAIEAFWDAVRSADPQAAAQVVQGAPDVLTAVEMVAVAQERVGALWSTGEWSVTDEHRATAISDAAVRSLWDSLPAVQGDPVLVACAEREFHALPSLLVVTYLRSLGIDARFLGANISRDNLVGNIVETGARAVLVSATLTSSLVRARKLVLAARGTSHPVVVGGRAFDADGVRADRVGATGQSTGLADLAGILAALPRHVGPAPTLRHPGTDEVPRVSNENHRLSQAAMAALEPRLVRGGTGADDPRTQLVSSLPHLIDMAAAATLTEDGTILDEARAWLGALLTRGAGVPLTVEEVWDAVAAQLRDFPHTHRRWAGR